MRRNSKNLKRYKDVCYEVWEERGKMCEDCGRYIREPKWHNFHHLNGRETEEKCMDKENIVLVCFKHHATREGKDVSNCEWLDY